MDTVHPGGSEPAAARSKLTTSAKQVQIAQTAVSTRSSSATITIIEYKD